MQRQARYDEPHYRLIDFIFYNERVLRELVEDEKRNYTRPLIYNNSGVADPTAYEVIKRLTPVEKIVIDGRELKRPEDWLLLIDKAYSWSKTQENNLYNLAQMRYLGLDTEYICFKLSIGVEMFYRLFNKFRQRALLLAAYYRLISL